MSYVSQSRNFAEPFDRGDAGFLTQFTQCRRPRLFARVDAALWHLPSVRFINVFGTFNAPANEGITGPVKHHDADARAIGQGFNRHQVTVTHHG